MWVVYLSRGVILASLLSYPHLAVATTVIDADLVSKYPDLVTIILGFNVLLLGWFMNRTVCKLDKNAAKMWETIDDVSKRLASLEGACAAVRDTKHN